MPFSLEHDQPRLHFRNNVLRAVVWQLRYPPLLLVDDRAFVGRVHAEFRADYPLAEPPAKAEQPWRFRDETEAWTVSLHTEHLSLETSEYTRYEDFRSRLEQLLEAVESLLDLRQVQRLGLRYVDEIAAPGARTPADFVRYLNEDLIGVVAGTDIAPFVRQAFQLIQLDVAGQAMTIRHGFIGADPEPLYVIDTDAYDESSRPYDRASCIQRTNEFKRHCWNVFRQSIRDELVDLLGAEDLVA